MLQAVVTSIHPEFLATRRIVALPLTGNGKRHSCFKSPISMVITQGDVRLALTFAPLVNALRSDSARRVKRVENFVLSKFSPLTVMVVGVLLITPFNSSVASGEGIMNGFGTACPGSDSTRRICVSSKSADLKTCKSLP